MITMARGPGNFPVGLPWRLRVRESTTLGSLMDAVERALFVPFDSAYVMGAP